MTYFNIVFTYGIEKFCKDAKSVGIDGLIIPDVTLETEAYDHLDSIAVKCGLHLIKFAGIDTDEKRLKEIAKSERGFTYCFSRRGITGVHKGLDPIIKQRLEIVRKYFKKPLGVGFGISKPEHIEILKDTEADFVIVGSAFIEAYKHGGSEELKKKAQELVSVL
jgi:tryptophan synthase alpha chain